MPSKVLKFRPPARRRFKRPICAREGDRFGFLEITDDSYLAFPVGSVAIIQYKKTCNGFIHALMSDEGVYLARLRFEGDAVGALSLHRDIPSTDYVLADVPVLGALVELYTTAHPTFRWVVYGLDQGVAESCDISSLLIG